MACGSFFWIVSWRASSQSMAAYRSSSLASITPNSYARVPVCQRRVVASLVSGPTIRDPTMNSARSRSGQDLEAISGAKPSERMAKDTAGTWPWAREVVISKLAQADTKVSPCKERRMMSMTLSGRWDRLPRVSFLTLPPSR